MIDPGGTAVSVAGGGLVGVSVTCRRTKGELPFFGEESRMEMAPAGPGIAMTNKATSIANDASRENLGFIVLRIRFRAIKIPDSIRAWPIDILPH